MPETTDNPRAAAYRQRLAVYVVWHPDFAQGRDLARRLYDHLMRDSRQPIARGLGIPVYYRSVADEPGSQAPLPIPLDKAHHTAVVALVDSAMVLDRDEGWGKYLSDLHKRISPNPDRHRLFPVKLDEDAFSVALGVDSSNFIRPVGDQSSEDWLALLQKEPYGLLNPITHELCRLLLREGRIEHGEEGGVRVSYPVHIFISHAKKDGGAIAERIRDHISRNTQLKSFFDVNDIPPGQEFARVLEEGVDREHTAMLVIQTDEYSTREWCQREVLWAKKYERPVLVLHGVRYGENCSFPYLGNAPTIRFDPEVGPDADKVLGQLLVEVLRNIHFRQHFEDLSRLFELGEKVRALPQTPELLTLLDLKSDPKMGEVKTVVYQEPPLGEPLLEILRRFPLDLTLTTPLLLLTSKGTTAGAARPLAGKTIGLSIGNSPDLARLGFDQAHVDDAAVEFARYLLEAGANLAYGGTLQAGGLTETLRDLVWTYDASEAVTPRLLGYLAWPYHRDKLKKDKEYKKWMDPKNLNRLTFEFVKCPPDQDQSQAGPPDDRSPASLLVYARCLTEMRQAMESAIHARGLLGGKLTGYMGCYPGLAEEAMLAMRNNKPLYLIGGFGGCAHALIEALLGEKPKSLTTEFQLQDDNYRQMVERHNLIAGVTPVDYEGLVGELEGWGLQGLSASNGLTEEENRRLFETPHVIEMVYLVLRGILGIIGGK